MSRDVPEARRLIEARDRFEDMLRTSTVEADWQRFFAANPFVLSAAMGLRLQPHHIRPRGRPGRAEPDFIFHPDDDSAADLYGVIELKRPDTTVVRRTRSNVAILTSTARTAVQQGQTYAEELGRQLVRPDERLVCLGNAGMIFVIMGMSKELGEKLVDDVLRQQIADALPRNLKVLPYDEVLHRFSREVPVPVHTLVPDLDLVARDDHLLVDDHGIVRRVEEDALCPVTITLDRGLIEMTLDRRLAPVTVDHFVRLTRQGFYDGLTFHRVVPDFVIQGGDPEGTGRGGPGYKFADELVRAEYILGAVAMANAGPNTNGSQFFICIDDCTRKLDKLYNLFGFVTSGIEVAQTTQVGDVMRSVRLATPG